jgi:hypothetical protein
LNTRLFVQGDTSLNANLYAAGKTVLQGDVSLNNRLFVQGDTSLNANLYAAGKTVLQGDVSLNTRLFVQGDTSLNANLYAAGKTVLQGDVSLNTRLFVQGDTSLNANLYAAGKTVLQGDVSMNSRLFINGDVSMNSRLFVVSDVSLGARLFVSGDSSLNRNVYVGGDVIIQGDLSLNGGMFLNTTNSIYIGNAKVGSSTVTTTNDLWTTVNLVDSPPVATIGTITYTSSSIYIPWTYPRQINVGFMSQPLPLINSLTVQYYYNNGSYNVSGYALQNASGINYISTVAGNSYNVITGVVLTNNSSAQRGISVVNFPSPYNSTRYAYTFYDPGFANLVSSPANAVTIYYSNYNATSTNASVSVAPFTGFASSGVPSAVLNLSFTTNSNSSNPVTIVFQYYPPTYSDSMNSIITSITSPIKQYLINYNTLGSSLRYGGPISNSGSITVNATSVNTLTPDQKTFTNFYPDSTYTFSIEAQNITTNTNYGISTSASLTTTYLNPVKVFDNISFSTSSTVYTQYTSALVTNSNVYSNVYLATSAGDWTSNSFGSPIHTLNNRASTDSSLLSVNATLGSYNVSVNYSGFPITNPGNVDGSGLSIITTTPTDSYSTYSEPYRGFYLQTSNQVKISSSSLTPSNLQKTLTVTQSQASVQTASSAFSFYFDTYSNPAVSSFTTAINANSGKTTSIQICGIWITYGTIYLNATTVASNLGNYFYNSTQLLRYNGTIITSEIGISNVTTSKSTILVSPTTISNTSGPVNYTSVSYQTTVPSISVTAYNQIGTTATAYSSAINMILDQPNYNLYSLLKSNINSAVITTTTSYGLRVYSGIPLSGTNVPNYLNGGTTAYSTLPFLNSWSLVNSSNTGNYDGTQELLMANGAFRTSDTNYAKSYLLNYYSNNSGSVLQNTLDYTNIGTTGYRFMTFAWKVSPTLSGSNTKLNISFSGSPSIVNSLLYADSGTNKILVYYRVEDTAAISSFTPNNASTYWISANDNATDSTNNGPVSGSNYYTVPGNNKPYYSPPTISSGLITAGLPIALSTNTTGLTNGNIYIYVRIGLPMSVSSCYISSIQAYLSS